MLVLSVMTMIMVMMTVVKGDGDSNACGEGGELCKRLQKRHRCVCVCVCVCEQTEGDVPAGSFQTQAASTISQLMIFNSKNESGSQKQDIQTQTRRHTKQKRRPFQSTLA